MRLVFFNDPHYSRHAPECRADTYPGEILDKFHECARIAKKIGASAIGCSGDWFHRKGKVTFREANDILTVLRSWHDKGLQPIGILGNHDIAGHALDSLDTRAVGTMVHSKVLQLLDHEPYHKRTEDGSVYVTGTSFFHGCDSTDENRTKMYGAKVPWETGPKHGFDEDGQPNPIHVHVCHGTLLQKGEFFEEFTTAEYLIELLYAMGKLPDVIVCGHLHFDEGIKLYDRPDGDGKVAVCRVGSLGRVASDDFKRTPNALVLAIKGRSVVCKKIAIGKDVLRGGETKDSRDPEEYEERIQEFVRVLREEADSWSLVDHRTLLQRVAEEMGHDEEIFEIAASAVEKRQ